MKLKGKNSVLLLFIILAFVTGFIAFAFSNPNGKAEEKASAEKMVEAAPKIVNLKFGLPVDSFKVISETVHRNEFLSNILQRYGISYQTIAELSEKSKDVFDVRDITAGSHYSVFCTNDTAQKVCYFIYEPNAIDYIVYNLEGDSIHIHRGKHPVTTLKKSVSGVINSSLYESLEKESADPRLTMKLADVYAWTIDFYDIKKGDWYKVEYEEKYVNGKAIETGNISSAVFHHDGETFYAFYFQPDSAKEGHYYDEHARSLRKAFLKAPLKFIRITSHYTLRRFHPVQKRWKAHLGTDYGAPTGTPIMTTGDGVVIASTFSRFNGNYVKVRHNATYTTQYLHMSKRAVRVGQHVKQGQVIGYVGSTGLATGPHVCYRFWKNGKQVDPLKQHFPAAEPVPQDEMQLFQQMVQRQEQTLADVGLDTAKTSV